MMHVSFHARAALIAAGLLFGSQLYAQAPQEAAPPTDMTAPPGMETAPTAQVEDAKVEKFAAAFVAVQDIQAQATQELSNAKDEQQATQVKTAAEQKMIEAVQREGLEVEEFNRIADLMTTDLALRSKVVEKVEKRRKG